MTDLTYSAPGLLFPAVSLLMLAYTNRFLGLASLIRHLVARSQEGDIVGVASQVRNLKLRLELLRHTQALGVSSLFCCTASIFAILIQSNSLACALFGLALMLMLASLSLSLVEIHLSIRAINVELDNLSR